MSAEEMHRHQANTPPLHEASSHEKMDPVLQTLMQQIRFLGESRQHIQTGLDQLTEAERSLQTLLPALEIQIRGWTNEIKQLQARLNETDSTYAEVVDKLDARLRRQQEETNKQLAALSASYEGKTQILREQIEALQAELASNRKPPAKSKGLSFSIHPEEEE